MEDAARQKQVILSKLSGINGSLPNVEPTKNVSIDLLSAEDNNFENISPKHQEILSKIDNTAQKYISELNELFCKVGNCIILRISMPHHVWCMQSYIWNVVSQ